MQPHLHFSISLPASLKGSEGSILSICTKHIAYCGAPRTRVRQKKAGSSAVCPTLSRLWRIWMMQRYGSMTLVAVSIAANWGQWKPTLLTTLTMQLQHTSISFSWTWWKKYLDVKSRKTGCLDRRINREKEKSVQMREGNSYRVWSNYTGIIWNIWPFKNHLHCQI